MSTKSPCQVSIVQGSRSCVCFQTNKRCKRPHCCVGTADPAPSDALADILLAAESGIDAAMTDSAGSSDSDASDPAAPAKLDFTSTDSLQDTGSSDEPAAGKGDDEKQQPEITEAVKASGDEKSSSEPLPADSEQKAVEPSAIDVQQAAAQDDRVDNPAESPADAEEDGIAKILAEIEAEDDWLLEGLSFDELQSDEERKAEEALLQSEAADVEDEAAAEDADADFDLMQILEDSKVGPEAEKSSAELPQPDKEPETAEPAQEAAATQGAAAAQAAEAKDTAPVKAAEEASSVPEQGIDELTADDPELLAEEAEIDVGEEAEDPEEEEEEDPFLREFEKSTPELEDEEAFLSGEDSFEDGQQEEEEVEEEEEGGDGLDYISDFEEAAGEAEQDVEDFADIEGEAEQWEGEEEDASLEDEEASEAL